MTIQTIARTPRNTIFQGDCIETMRRFERGSVDFILTDPPYIILQAFYGLSPTDPLHSETSTTARQFARGFVGDRSRILHGTWSTLNSRLALGRGGMEEFVIAVIRRAAFELENYASTAMPNDELDAWLAWVGANSRPSTVT